MPTATAVEDSTLVRIDKQAMIRTLQDEPTFFALFLTYLLARTISHPGGLGGSTLQFQRETADANTAVNGPLRKRGQAGGGHSEDQPGNARRHDRHHAFPCQFLHEEVPQAAASFTTTTGYTCTVPSSLLSSTTSPFPLRHVDVEWASVTRLSYFFKTEQFGLASHPSLAYPLA